MQSFKKRIITGTVLTLLFFLIFFTLPPYIFSILLGIILTAIILFEWPKLFSPYTAAFWLLMPLYPMLPFICMILMNQNDAHRYLLLLLFIIVPSHDVGSYFAGSLFGKNKIAPTVSPGKTWEGFFGGFMVSCLALALALHYYAWTTTTTVFFVLTFILCVLGLCGDLFESWLKRRVHIKDSGTLLPGHGGLLDRFDGIIFGAVLMFLIKDFLLTLILKK